MPSITESPRPPSQLPEAFPALRDAQLRRGFTNLNYMLSTWTSLSGHKLNRKLLKPPPKRGADKQDSMI